jgi:hypothetical protein
MRLRNSLTGTLLLTIAAFFATGVQAEPPAEPDWEAQVVGYGWLAEIYGDLEAGPVKTTLDIRIDDVLRSLTWVGSAGFEARYHAVLFQMDGLAQQFHDNVGGPRRTVSFAPLGGVYGGGTATVGPAAVSFRSTSVIGEAALGYRALSVPLSTWFSSVPAEDPRRFRLDLLGGARYWYLRNTARLSIPPATLSVGGVNIPGGTVVRIAAQKLGDTRIPGRLLILGSRDVFTTTTSWIDSIIGFRVGADVTDTVSLALRADIGGFGFGDSSRFSWQLVPSVQWRFADHWSFDGAYRALGVDKGVVSDAVLYGFVLGIGYRF